jgi:hypothetical protein
MGSVASVAVRYMGRALIRLWEECGCNEKLLRLAVITCIQSSNYNNAKSMGLDSLLILHISVALAQAGWTEQLQ